MLGIAIRCIQHSQAMLERWVRELAHSFFISLIIIFVPYLTITVPKKCSNIGFYTAKSGRCTTFVLYCIWYISLAETCQILNGECGDICIPVANGRRCECDIGLQLQDDFTCDSSMLCYLLF